MLQTDCVSPWQVTFTSDGSQTSLVEVLLHDQRA